MPTAAAAGRKVRPGRPYPFGATPQEGGVNFALWSQGATEVRLLLFDRPDGPPTDELRLEGPTRFVWHLFVEGLKPGQLYGFKVDGPFEPRQGLRFNAHKLLLDPYAKAVSGKFVNRDNLLLAYDASSPERDLSFDARDNSHVVPKAVVVDDRFDWQGDEPIELPPQRLVIYETHLKAFTAHASSKVSEPGTYLGFIEKIPHLKSLGVNAVELLPVHEHYVEDFLRAKGLTNHWGYNTIGFFAPESSYAARAGAQVDEFKTLVRELHKAGIQVILDVVYNHTGEGNELGPTMSLRGIDNRAYYALTGAPHEPGRYYMNWSGCGNSLTMAHPQALRLVMDSLRYWVEQMHVDGFRFDLASVLGREAGHYQRSTSFFDAVGQDPTLSRALFIAEPWDLGTYQVGNFPVDWSEWNGRFRDTARRFVKGDPGQLADLGFRLTGSPDLYGDDGRSPYDSVNFVTCHDGFTLWDLVSYDAKHNEANLEENRDGSNDNHSWNCGAEGETSDLGVLALRRRLAKNHLCLLLLSSGTPMLLGGDEFLRTQRGNNNAYCQDNELSWLDWTLAEKNADFLRFARKLVSFRRRHPALQRRKFLVGRDADRDGVPDVSWFGPDGGPPRWEDPEARSLAFRLDRGDEPGSGGRPIRGGRVLALFVILNAHHEARGFKLPPAGPGRRWFRVADTSLASPHDFADEGSEVALDPQHEYVAGPRSTVVLIAA